MEENHSGEYDWRGVYGKVLGRKVSVVEASSGAVLSGGYPVLHDGETLAVDFAHDGRGGFVDCVLVGNGTLYNPSLRRLSQYL